MLDISKQIFSCVLIHFINLASSLYFNHTLPANGCVWYFVFYLMDTICILPLCFIFIESADYYFAKYGYNKLVSGEYYDNSGDVDYEVWGLQTIIWLLIVLIGKVIELMIQFNTKHFMYDMGKECLKL